MYEFLDYQTRDVMTLNPVTTAPDRPISEVEEIFEKHDFNGLPVLDAEGQVIGVITKLDLLRAFHNDGDRMFPPYKEIMRRTVSSAMTPKVRSVCPRTPLTRVLEKMVVFGCKSFPVLDGDQLVGVVAREDVLRGLRRAAAGERAPSGDAES
jgi:CBS domain-containing protein